MIRKLIEFSIRERGLVAVAAALLLIGGLYAFRYLNVEVYPDPSPPTIEIIAQNPGWSAEEMERQITIPLETQLNGMRGLDTLRTISLFGLTDVKCYFVWGTDYWDARQEVINKLQSVELPRGVQPELSPWSALGEIYRYQVIGEGYTPLELKEAQDWILVRQFKQVPGILDVVSFGGPTKEFHVDLDPNKLIAFGVSVSDVMEALAKNNSNVGGNYLDAGEQSYNVRGIGLFRDADDIGNVMVTERKGTPLYVRQLGEVSIGNAVRLGKVGRDNDPDIVKGIVYMRRGEQTQPTLERVHKKVEETVFGGAQLRLRPVLMTALAAAIGLFPAAVATGMGSQTQQPLARVVVGGMITAPVLTLLVLPALYMIVHQLAEARASRRIGKSLPNPELAEE